MFEKFTNTDFKKRVFIIVASILAVAVVAGITVFLIKFIERTNRANGVKDALNKASVVMKQEKDKVGAYPADISNALASSNKSVTLSGSSSFDGVSYCIAGRHKDDKTIVYHVDSKSSTPVSGDCSSGSNLSAPAVPGGVAVAFVTNESLKVIWNQSPSAASYTLQCATDSDFKHVVTSDKTDKLEGICKGLTTNIPYYYRVAAVNSAGTSAWSTTQSITTGL